MTPPLPASRSITALGSRCEMECAISPPVATWRVKSNCMPPGVSQIEKPDYSRIGESIRCSGSTAAIQNSPIRAEMDPWQEQSQHCSAEFQATSHPASGKRALNRRIADPPLSFLTRDAG